MNTKVLGMTVRLLVVLTAILGYFYLRSRLPEQRPNVEGPIRGVVVRNNQDISTVRAQKCDPGVIQSEALKLDAARIPPPIKKAVEHPGEAVAIVTSAELERIRSLLQMVDPLSPKEVRSILLDGASCYIVTLETQTPTQ